MIIRVICELIIEVFVVYKFLPQKAKKGFILAEVGLHHTEYTFRELHTRRMYNLSCEVKSAETMQQELLDLLPEPEKAQGAMIRLELSYPQEWEAMFNEKELRSRAEGALDFRLKRKPIHTNRIRIQSGNISSLTQGDLLRAYCQSARISEGETEQLLTLAERIFSGTGND